MKTLIPILLMFVFLLVGMSPSLAAYQPSGKIDFAALDATIEAQMAKHGLPGVALAVIENGEIVYLKGYGTAGHGQPMTAQTQMLIGSQSKSFTALAIAQLAERGQLDLSAPVQTYIPWFRVAAEAVVQGKTPPPVSQGWSVRWVGWAIGLLCLGLVLLHTRNFLALRGWSERAQAMPTGKVILDISISFIIPIVILIIIFTQVRGFYGNRFNWLTNLAYFRLGLPDIFILMLIGVLPDLTQGFIKLSQWFRIPK